MKKAWAFFSSLALTVSLGWAADTARTTLRIEGMTCSSCVSEIRHQLDGTPGVTAFEVSFEKAEAEVTYDPAKTTPARIAESVSETGYRTSIKAAAQEGAVLAPSSGESLERVTLFQVPLMCSAVRGLGCGGKARPFMALLEQNVDVSEAWLNHPGTVLAIVWKQPQPHGRAATVIDSVFEREGMQVSPIQGPALTEAVQDFASRNKWYRGQDVDRLSEQEAEVMAERIVRRVESRTALSPTQAAALRAHVGRICADMLLKGGPREMKVFLDGAGKYLDAKQMGALEKAIAAGFGALPGELGS